MSVIDSPELWGLIVNAYKNLHMRALDDKTVLIIFFEDMEKYINDSIYQKKDGGNFIEEVERASRDELLQFLLSQKEEPNHLMRDHENVINKSIMLQIKYNMENDSTFRTRVELKMLRNESLKKMRALDVALVRDGYKIDCITDTTIEIKLTGGDILHVTFSYENLVCKPGHFEVQLQQFDAKMESKHNCILEFSNISDVYNKVIDRIKPRMEKLRSKSILNMGFLREKLVNDGCEISTGDTTTELTLPNSDTTIVLTLPDGNVLYIIFMYPGNPDYRPLEEEGDFEVQFIEIDKKTNSESKSITIWRYSDIEEVYNDVKTTILFSS